MNTDEYHYNLYKENDEYHYNYKEELWWIPL